MDLDTIAQEETHWDDPIPVELYHNGKQELDKDGKPVRVFVVSEYATAVREVERKQGQDVTSLLAIYTDVANIPAEIWENQALEKTAASIVGWEGFTMKSGAEPLKYTPENAVVLVKAFKTHRPDQLKQIQNRIKQHAKAFQKNSDG